ncbi:MAG: site-2 protease family protein [ANME-2 cluster archaeon]|nr:site-2 protease family protein [ANME-2 cluster archaeon]
MSQPNIIITFVESYWKILLIIAIYWQTVLILKQYGILERYNITNHGPLLMIRTTKGQRFLDRIAKLRGFWRIFADVGIPLMLLGMFLMFALIIFSDISMLVSLENETMPPPGEFHELRNIFLLPGINEFIPLVWGLIGLVVTLVVHEFSHAILCKVEDVKVKSMGIIMVLIPIGGFAEPDEEQLFGDTKDKTDEEGTEKRPDIHPVGRRQRVRILSAGVMANFVTALVAFMLFFIVIGNIAAVTNVMITDVVPGSPADDMGLTDLTLITHVNGNKIENASDFYEYVDTRSENESLQLMVKKDNILQEVMLTPYPNVNGNIRGVKFENVIPGMPGEDAGLKDGLIITRINNTPITGTQTFFEYMANTTAGQEITMCTLFENVEVNYTINLTSDSSNGNTGFIGISEFSTVIISRSTGLSVGEYPARELLHFLQMIPTLMGGVAGWIIILVLPFPNPLFWSFQGFSGTLSMFYEPIGWAAPLGVGVFWLANSLLWIGWLNFYVGLFNCLPMLPLDGGHVFKDMIHSILARLFGNEEKMGDMAGKIATLFAILMLASLIFMIIAPFIAQFLAHVF